MDYTGNNKNIGDDSMALINCPECNKNISDTVDACPHCGFKLSNKIIVTQENEKTQKPTKSVQISSKTGCLVMVILSIITILLWVGLFHSCTNTGTGSDQTSSDNTYLSSNNDTLSDITSNNTSSDNTSSDDTISYPDPELIVNSNGKKMWKMYYFQPYLHLNMTYNGTGNFIVSILDNNEDLYTLAANEIGDYVLNKTVEVPPTGDFYYLEIEFTDGSYTGNWNPTDYAN